MGSEHPLYCTRLYTSACAAGAPLGVQTMSIVAVSDTAAGARSHRSGRRAHRASAGAGEHACAGFQGAVGSGKQLNSAMAAAGACGPAAHLAAGRPPGGRGLLGGAAGELGDRAAALGRSQPERDRRQGRDAAVQQGAAVVAMSVAESAEDSGAGLREWLLGVAGIGERHVSQLLEVLDEEGVDVFLYTVPVYKSNRWRCLGLFCLPRMLLQCY